MTTRMMRLGGMLLAAAMVCAAGCTGRETSSYADVPDSGWVYGHSFEYAADTLPLPQGARADLKLWLMHDNGYPYRNVWLETSYRGVDSLTHTDTLNIELCDRFGRWFGKGFGSGYQIESTLEGRVAPAPGTPVRVRHVMRVDTLRGISRVGLDIIAR